VCLELQRDDAVIRVPQELSRANTRVMEVIRRELEVTGHRRHEPLRDRDGKRGRIVVRMPAFVRMCHDDRGLPGVEQRRQRADQFDQPEREILVGERQRQLFRCAVETRQRARQFAAPDLSVSRRRVARSPVGQMRDTNRHVLRKEPLHQPGRADCFIVRMSRNDEHACACREPPGGGQHGRGVRKPRTCAGARDFRASYASVGHTARRRVQMFRTGVRDRYDRPYVTGLS
jgi:hypothetical protein